MVKTMLAGLADFVFPPECPGCGWRTGSRFLCRRCLATLRDAADPVVTARRPERTAWPVALWLFEEDQPIQRVMHQLKYGNRPWVGIEIGRMLGGKLVRRLSARPDLVIPVPLHETRRFDRGYNQSEWIARGLGKIVGAEPAAEALRRIRPTRSQTSLAREERTANVEAAFVAGDDVVGAVIVLVDDTLTTGATLFACAGALVEAGARSVLPCAAAAAALRAAVEPDPSIPVIPA